MIDGPASMCDTRLNMVRHPVVKMYLWLYTISFCVAISLSIVVIFKFYRRQFFGNSFKVLLFLLVIFTVMLNSALLGSTISTQYVTYFHEFPCDNLFYTRNCLWAMYPNSMGIVGLVITQFALSVERYFASLHSNGSKKDRSVPGFLLATIVIAASSIVVFCLFMDVDPIEPNWRCAGIPYSVAHKANILFAVLIGVDVLAVVIFVRSWKINVRNKQNGTYSISKTLHIEANLLVMRLFLPVVLAHFIMFSIHILGQMIIRTPLCTLVQLLMFISILKKEDLRKKNDLNRQLETTKNIGRHGELYGTGLNLQWNR